MADLIRELRQQPVWESGPAIRGIEYPPWWGELPDRDQATGLSVLRGELPWALLSVPERGRVYLIETKAVGVEWGGARGWVLDWPPAERRPPVQEPPVPTPAADSPPAADESPSGAELVERPPEPIPAGPSSDAAGRLAAALAGALLAALAYPAVFPGRLADPAVPADVARLREDVAMVRSEYSKIATDIRTVTSKLDEVRAEQVRDAESSKVHKAEMENAKREIIAASAAGTARVEKKIQEYIDELKKKEQPATCEPNKTSTLENKK